MADTKNIAFISIFDLTEVFHAVSSGLAEAGHQVHWMATSPHWADWLSERGVSEDRLERLIYSESDFVSASEKSQLLEQMLKTEADSDLTFNQALQMDRFVLHKQWPTINEYVYLFYRDIRRFLQERNIDVVFSEPTNVNEIITYMLCRELGIRFLAPCDMRYPHRRFIFTEGYLQQTAHGPGEEERSWDGNTLVQEFAEKQARPFYFEKHNKAKIITVRKLATAVKNRISRGQLKPQPNLTHHDITERVRLLARRSVNSRYLQHLAEYDKLDDIQNRIAFYGLHVQPESSIDVRGSYFSDQIKLIQDMRRALPFDVTLVVKEHPNFLGIRGKEFFDRVRAIPNVKLLHHNVATFDIYKRAALVLTVSGTTAYEAGLLGIPAVTFSPMYFGGLSTVYYCGEITQLKELTRKLLAGVDRDYDADCRFMERLVSKSYPGLWTDPIFVPDVLSEDNVRKLTHGFLAVVET